MLPVAGSLRTQSIVTDGPDRPAQERAVASRGAGLAPVITRTPYPDDHDFSGAVAILPELGEVGLPQLRHWHSLAYGIDKKV